MKNKVDYGLAKSAAEKIQLRLEEGKYQGFPDVCDFCAKENRMSDGELRLKGDDIKCLSIKDFERRFQPDDASCFEAEKCKISQGGSR